MKLCFYFFLTCWDILLLHNSDQNFLSAPVLCSPGAVQGGLGERGGTSGKTDMSCPTWGGMNLNNAELLIWWIWIISSFDFVVTRCIVFIGVSGPAWVWAHLYWGARTEASERWAGRELLSDQTSQSEAEGAVTSQEAEGRKVERPVRRAQAVQDTQDTGPGLQYTPAIWVDTVSGERVSQCCDIITTSENWPEKVVE